MGLITVIGFGSGEDDLRADAEFIRRIGDATVESLLLLAAEPEKLPLAPVAVVRRMRGEEQSFGPEATLYSSVYFLNAEAVAMCREKGLRLAVIGEADSMPDETSYEMQAHYLPSNYKKAI